MRIRLKLSIMVIAILAAVLAVNSILLVRQSSGMGMGLAAAADEICKPAESSSELSKTIGTVLKKIKESIDKITVSAANVLEKFGAIDSSVKTVAEQEESIRSALKEQGEGNKQILEGISNVTEITRQPSSSSHETLEGANEINAAVNHVNKTSSQNRYGIGVLMEEVSKIKVA